MTTASAVPANEPLLWKHPSVRYRNTNRDLLTNQERERWVTETWGATHLSPGGWDVTERWLYLTVNILHPRRSSDRSKAL